MPSKAREVPDYGQLDTLYEHWALEVVPALAPAAADLFKGRPQRFKKVDSTVVDILARFHYQTGYDQDHLNEEQRRALLMPLLGESDGKLHDDQSSEFHRAAWGVRQAAVDFVQRSEETGEAQLRSAFLDALTTFRRYLTSLLGAVVNNAVARTRQYFDDMVKVMQDPGYAAGVGLPPAPSGGGWPLGLDLDGDGAVLVEEIRRQAMGAGMSLMAGVDQQDFIVIQRIGHFGRLTIQGALNGAEPDDERTDALIGDAYRWWTALGNLGDH